ncbi:MAG: AAA family ATPase [Melioribacteraceae bacterium]|nr:AAA family ATPase [Melioribacteraceae bacterium]
MIISNATLFGQVTKDVDLIAIGKFEKYSITIKSKAKTNKAHNLTDEELEKLSEKERLVFVNDFCFVFETKRHRAEDVRLEGTTLLVRYNSKLSDVTVQSENQKYSLKSFFEDRLNFSPYISNFIWLRNVSWDSLKELIGENENLYNKHNYLPDVFSFRFLLQLAAIQQIPYTPIHYNESIQSLKGYSTINSLHKNIEYNLQEIDSMFEVFERIKEGKGELTRKKIERITTRLLKNQNYAKSIGEKLVIISGRAGTGKTIKLLNIACNLATENGARCLILTYNHALVSDIKRTLALAEIPDGVDDHTVNISTLHKFFYEILLGFEIGAVTKQNDKKFIPNYLNNYENLLKELLEYINEELIGDAEISELMKSRHQQVGWDYLLIDEAQDWETFEKDIIFRIFGKSRIIIADGVDQLIRSHNKLNWTRKLKPNFDFTKTFEKRGLRQKINLVTFVNALADKVNINWELEGKKELIGGKIIISLNEYNEDLHNQEYRICKQNGNSAYEMLFLVPPSMVDRKKITDKYGNQISQHTFQKISHFEQMGIPIWDGTSNDLRTEYSVNLNEHRLLQYESCRGLEGWTVACLNFDDFIQYKYDTFADENKDNPQQSLALETFEEMRHKFIYLWSLIPLTRAIDTLIITIRDKDSFIAKKLKEVYQENPDIIEWIE